MMRIITTVEIKGRLVTKEFISRDVQLAHLTALYVLDPNLRILTDAYRPAIEERVIEVSLSKEIDLR